MPNRRHTSFVIEHRGGVYWFDAGEGCAYTAHLLGVDLLAVQAIFISHVHMDVLFTISTPLLILYISPCTRASCFYFFAPFSVMSQNCIFGTRKLQILGA